MVSGSGDNPFLYRLELAIDSDASNLYPSDLALYVRSEKFLPTDESTKILDCATTSKRVSEKKVYKTH